MKSQCADIIFTTGTVSPQSQCRNRRSEATTSEPDFADTSNTTIYRASRKPSYDVEDGANWYGIAIPVVSAFKNFPFLSYVDLHINGFRTLVPSFHQSWSNKSIRLSNSSNSTTDKSMVIMGSPSLGFFVGSTVGSCRNQTRAASALRNWIQKNCTFLTLWLKQTDWLSPSKRNLTKFIAYWAILFI